VLDGAAPALPGAALTLSYLERLAANIEHLENRLARGESLGWKDETLELLRWETNDARLVFEQEQRRLLDPAAKVRY
jgi:hypothetical protein